MFPENDIIVELSASQQDSRPMHRFLFTWNNSIHTESNYSPKGINLIEIEVLSFSIANAFLLCINEWKLKGYGNLLLYLYDIYGLNKTKFPIKILINNLRNFCDYFTLQVYNPSTERWAIASNSKMKKLIPDY